MLDVPFYTSNRPGPGLKACIQWLDCDTKEDQVGSKSATALLKKKIKKFFHSVQEYVPHLHY